MAKAGVTAFAMEFMPRITRAQSMDVLSSQANLAGYQAVIDGAAEYDRALPMMMTAAGTVPAAKVFIMGVGVAGLQAIATARRLGAVVTATDVRPAAKEQVASLGAKFLAVEDEEFKAAETAGGYAKEMSKEYQAKQAALTAEHIAKQDIVITTALIPGRPAPKLVSAAMVASMKPGSVIVDLAVERGGNVEGAVAGKVVDHRQRRQDRRPSQRAGPCRGVRLAALRQEPVRLPRDDGRQGDEAARHQSRRRTGQGDDADRWRQGRASEFRQGRGATACRAGRNPAKTMVADAAPKPAAPKKPRKGAASKPPPSRRGSRDGTDLAESARPARPGGAAVRLAVQNLASSGAADAAGDAAHALSGGAIDPFVFRFAIFVLAIFVGYYVVWSVTPALHTPLMAVTNAISSVIVVGALLAVGISASGWRPASASSRWCWPRSTSSAASSSPSACWRCTRRKRSER